MTQYRLSLPSMIAAVAAAAALGLPGMASAAYEHPANNEKGVIVHPEHFKSEKTRRRSSRKPRPPCSGDVFPTARATSQSARPMWGLARRASR